MLNMLKHLARSLGAGQNGAPVDKGAGSWNCIAITCSCVGGEGAEVTRGADFDAECWASAPRRGLTSVALVGLVVLKANADQQANVG